MQLSMTDQVKFLQEYSDSIKPNTTFVDIKNFELPEYSKTNKKKPELKSTQLINRTENEAVAYTHTGSYLLDLFSSTVRNFDKEKIFYLLDKSWIESPLKTVQLILHTRDVRNGKGEIKLGQFLLFWLRCKHANTYVNNLHLFMEVGYYKDLWRIIDMAKIAKLDKLGSKTWIEIEYLNQVLEQDKLNLQNNKNISLAAKWTPKEGNHYHEYLVELAKLRFPTKSRSQFRKWIMPLRNHLRITENLMCSNKWNEVKYESVPAYCMKFNNKSFEKHDKERYTEFLKQVKTGEKKLNVAGLQPHEIIEQIYRNNSDELLEVQWSSLIKRIKEKTKLNKCLAVSDVSGSMSGTPLLVSIALGFMLALVQNENDNPFYKTILTFSQNPVLHKIEGNTIYEQVMNISRMQWDMNTDFVKVFDLLLSTAQLYQVKQENMIETIFVFTDMQFDQASNTEKTPFEEIKEKYKKAGYNMPKIVFWNLRDSSGGFPINNSDENVALVSGFSAELMQLFIDGQDFNPMTILNSALSKYPNVVIHRNDL